MNMATKLVLSCVGTFLVPAVGFYQLHNVGPFNAAFWIGFSMAGLLPLGSYFIGLAQRAPWEQPK